MPADRLELEVTETTTVRGAGESGIPTVRLELEITETTTMRDVEHSTQVLAELRKLGVHVSIDDFGTGYSSLNYLQRFMVDAIKIDKSFVDGIGHDHNAEVICDTILRIGHALGMRVIAEGVETEAQVVFLRLRKCNEAQGYLFGKPVTSEEFERTWLTSPPAAAAGLWI
jgi:EAL domain-containing protein (putative c-di-GMP-specific phosphodiesterase class I)